MLTGLIAAIVVFGYLGFFSKLTNTKINDLPIAGHDLVFITYPAVLNFLPFTRFWLAIFFFMLVLIGIDSQFATVDMMAYLLQNFNFKYKGQPIREEILKLFLCGILALLGFVFSTRRGFYYLSFVDSYVIALPLAFINFLNYFIFCKLKRQKRRG